VYEYIAIGRMKAGWHGADLAGGSSRGGQLESYVKHAIDGAVVYDASEADYGACVSLVMSGPMFKPTLYGVRRFNDLAAAARRMLPGLEDGFHTLTASALAGANVAGYGSFDYVGWAEYRQLLETRLGAGVRFGRVVRSGALAATVRWEDGTEQGWCFL
jgi:hypothetical protein